MKNVKCVESLRLDCPGSFIWWGNMKLAESSRSEVIRRRLVGRVGSSGSEFTCLRLVGRGGSEWTSSDEEREGEEEEGEGGVV